METSSITINFAIVEPATRVLMLVDFAFIMYEDGFCLDWNKGDFNDIENNAIQHWSEKNVNRLDWEIFNILMN